MLRCQPAVSPLAGGLVASGDWQEMHTSAAGAHTVSNALTDTRIC
jgi:hypothetical protein